MNEQPRNGDEYAAIPDELKDRDQWLLWDNSADTPRRPHWAGNFKISWSDPDDWHSFEAAVETASEEDSWGIGYVMGLDNDDHAHGVYGCLDLDGCVVDGGGPKEWLPSLEPFISDGAYMEYSASGDGIHIPLVGQQAPEWWSDSHFSPDEHEGVEYLTNKFVAFTGDAMEACAGQPVGDTNPAPFLFDAYKELNGESPTLDVDDDSNDYDSDDEFSQEQIEAALSNLDPGCAYPKWRNLAFAVHDWDSGPTGKGIFESWSRGSSAWDEQSQRLINRIWEDSEQGDGITVGTLIHHATEAGWSPSREEKPPLDATSQQATDGAQSAADSGDGAQPTETDGGATTASSGGSAAQPSIEQQVRGALADQENDVIQAKTARHRIARAFIDKWDFVFPEESVRNWRTKLYVYDGDEGVYEPRGEAFVERKLEVLAGDYVTNQVRNEIVGKIERMSKTDMELSTDPERLVVGNGILDLHTGELDDYSPHEYHSTKIEVDWNPDAGDPEKIDEFLHDIVEDDDVSTLYRLMAHTLYKEYLGEKAAILIGSGSNGKSMFLSLIEEFVGSYNVAHRELQDFDNDGFAANNLQGKMANLATEIGEQEIENATTFKKLTGRDSMQARVKYEKPIKFENFATLMFATNEMPVFGQDNHAIWRRWLYVDFPYTFDADDPTAKDPKPERQLKAELFNDEEFEALLLRCQKEIQRWFTGEPFFADAMDAEEVRTKMKKAAEPVYHFATTCLEATGDEDDFVKKPTVRTCYKAFAAEEDLPRIAENEFGKRLMALRDLQLDSKQKRVDGARPWVYEGVKLTSRARQLLGRDEPDEEDDQQQVGDSGQAKRIVLERCREMVEESDEVEPVPREGVVWGCSTEVPKTTAENAVDQLLEEGKLYEPQDGYLLPT